MPTSCCAIGCVVQIVTEKEAMLNSTASLLMRIEETFGLVPCVGKAGALRSIQGYAANIFYQVIYL